MLTHSPRAFPLGDEPPVGTPHVKRKAPLVRPEGGDRARGSACAKGADASTSRGAGTSATARSRNASGEVRRWQAARRQARHRQDAEVKARTPRPRNARRQRAKAASQAIENPEVTPPRGHAAENFFPLRSAIGQAATNPRDLAPQPGSLLLRPPAVRPFAMSGTANASGSLAAPWMAGRSEPIEYQAARRRRCRGNAQTPAADRPRGHLRDDDPSTTAPVVNYRVASARR